MALGRPQTGSIYDEAGGSTVDPPGAALTTAEAINDRGEVTGSYVDRNGTHGFIYDQGSFTIIDLPGAAKYRTP